MTAAAKVLHALRVPGAPGSEVPTSTAMLTNPDLAPVRPENRKWAGFNYFAFWASDSININSFQIAATGIIAGLAWWQAWLAIIVGYSIVALFAVVNARAPSVYHVGFPVMLRSSFGLWGSLWPVFQRAVMACVWFGVQSYLGGQCVTLVLRSLAPSYRDLSTTKNTISDPTTTSMDVLSFAIFQILNFGLLWPTPQQIRHLFTVKAIVVPIAAIIFLIWTLVEAKGAGSILAQPSKLSGSKLAWTWIAACTSCVSNMATLATSISDYARLATTPSATVVPQLVGIPVTFAFTSLIGIIISSASTQLYGEPQWNPLTVLSLKLDADPYNAGNRAGVFFIGLAFIVAQLGTNIAANSLSAGSDLTALLPRYISIRRGQIIAWIVGFSYCPWIILSSSSNFASYLSAFSVFLSSILGVMVADYWIVRRGHIDLPDLYCKPAKGTTHAYYFTAGVNWRAYVAYLLGLTVNMPGFVGVCRGIAVSEDISNMYNLAFFLGFIVSAIVYVALQALFPQQGAVPLRNQGWLEPAGGSWEALDWDVPIWEATQADARRLEREEMSPSSVDEKEKSADVEDKPVADLYHVA